MKFLKDNIYALITLAIVLRVLFAAFYTVAGDACWHFVATRFIADHGALPLFENVGRSGVFWPPVAFHLVAALVIKVFSVISTNFSLFLVKLIAPILSAFGLIYAYKLFRKLKLSQGIIVFALFFLGFTPLLLYYGYIPYMSAMVLSLSIISIYYFLCKRYVVSGIFFGAALLTKYNAFPMGIFFVWLLYKYVWTKKEPIKNTLLFGFPVLIIAGWFYVRNWVQFGSPLYVNRAYFNPGTGFWNLEIYLTQFRGFFGVPNGDPNNLALLDSISPYLVPVWMVMCALYLIPFVVGLYKFKKINARWFVVAGLFGYVLFYFYSIYLRADEAFIRFQLPAMVFAAIIWGNGMDTLFKHKRKIMTLLLIGWLALFVIQEPAKLYVANNQWSLYDDVFSWTQANLEPDALIVDRGTIGQCLPYKTNRMMMVLMYEPPANQPVYIWAENNPNLPSGVAEIHTDARSNVKIYKASIEDIST